MTLGDTEFFTDTAMVAFDPTIKRKRGTDGAMAREFLAKNGYVFPRDFAYARLVYLTDEARNKELMIIFIDDLAAYGFTAAELNEGGSSASRYDEVEQALIDRIKATLSVTRPE